MTEGSGGVGGHAVAGGGQTGALQGSRFSPCGPVARGVAAGEPGDELPRRASRAEPAGGRCDRGPERLYRIAQQSWRCRYRWQQRVELVRQDGGVLAQVGSVGGGSADPAADRVRGSVQVGSDTAVAFPGGRSQQGCCDDLDGVRPPRQALPQDAQPPSGSTSTEVRPRGQYRCLPRRPAAVADPSLDWFERAA